MTTEETVSQETKEATPKQAKQAKRDPNILHGGRYDMKSLNGTIHIWDNDKRRFVKRTADIMRSFPKTLRGVRTIAYYTSRSKHEKALIDQLRRAGGSI